MRIIWEHEPDDRRSSYLVFLNLILVIVRSEQFLDQILVLRFYNSGAFYASIDFVEFLPISLKVVGPFIQRSEEWECYGRFIRRNSLKHQQNKILAA